MRVRASCAGAAAGLTSSIPPLCEGVINGYASREAALREYGYRGAAELNYFRCETASAVVPSARPRT